MTDRSKRVSFYPSRFELDKIKERVTDDLEFEIDYKIRKIYFWRRGRNFDEFWLAKLMLKHEEYQVAILADGLTLYLRKSRENERAIAALEAALNNSDRKKSKRSEEPSKLEVSKKSKTESNSNRFSGRISGSASRSSQSLPQNSSNSDHNSSKRRDSFDDRPPSSRSTNTTVVSKIETNQLVASPPPVKKVYGKPLQAHGMLGSYDYSNTAITSRKVTPTPVSSRGSALLSPSNEAEKRSPSSTIQESSDPLRQKQRASQIWSDRSKEGSGTVDLIASPSTIDTDSDYGKSATQRTPPPAIPKKRFVSDISPGGRISDGIASNTSRDNAGRGYRQGNWDRQADRSYYGPTDDFRKVDWAKRTRESWESDDFVSPLPIASPRRLSMDNEQRLFENNSSWNANSSRFGLLDYFSRNNNRGNQSAVAPARDGMRNFGNSCYINAALQALLSLRPLTEDFSSPLWKSMSLMSEDVEHQDKESLGQFVKLLVDLIKSPVGVNKTESLSGRTVANLSPLKALVDRHSSLFLGSGQQDSHEFLMEFLWTIQQACTSTVEQAISRSRALQRILSERSKSSRQEIESGLSQALVPTSRQLHAVVTVEMTCNYCGNQKPPKEEIYRDFSLNVRPNGNEPLHVADLLREYFSTEEREVDCEYCKMKPGSAKVTTKLSVVPNILIIHLKRFQYDVSFSKFEKLSTPVNFPVELNLAALDVPHTHDWRASKISTIDMKYETLDAAAMSNCKGGTAIEQLLAIDDVVDSNTTSELATTEPISESGSIVHKLQKCLFKPISSQLQCEVKPVLAKASPVGVAVASPELSANLPLEDIHQPKTASLQRLSANQCQNTIIKPLVAVAEPNFAAANYSLSAVIRHLGTTPSSGHFICDSLVSGTSASKMRATPAPHGPSDRWERCNDSIVTSISQERVLDDKSSAYVLIYTRACS